MLNHHSFIKSIIFSLVLATSISFTPTARAQSEIEAMTNMVELMDRFFDLMNSIYAMNADDEKAILLQLNAMEEIYKDQGKHQDAVAVYKRVLQKSANPTVRNIAYHRMADVLKEAGDFNGSIGVLNEALEETLKRTK